MTEIKVEHGKKSNYVIRLDEGELDLINRELWLGGQPIDVSLYEFAYVAILAAHANQPIHVNKLFQLAGGDTTGRLQSGSNSVVKLISKFHEKLGQRALIKAVKDFPGCYMIECALFGNQDFQTTLEIRDLSLDLISLRGCWRGVEFSLTQKEAKFLIPLILSAGAILPDTKLYEALDESSPGLTNVLSFTTCRINKKVGAPPLIVRVRKQGYKLNVKTSIAYRPMAEQKVQAGAREP